LTIGAVADRTSVSVPVLRAWELRFGFPEPDRAASGHRRYSERDVRMILRVLRERKAGLSLEAAIERARHVDSEPLPSIFAELRDGGAGLPFHVLSRRSMLAVSHALEDESAARAERGVLVAAFQTERRYRRSEARWRDLARTAAGVLVFADFERAVVPPGWPAEDPSVAPGAPIEVPIAPGSPLRSEWAVVVDAPTSAALLSGSELDRGEGVDAPDRWFDATWSVEPRVVRRATELALALARRHVPEVDLFADALSGRATAPLDPDATVRNAVAITNRIVAYLA
jgi:DNA-binding transcriptional MerR regulator